MPLTKGLWKASQDLLNSGFSLSTKLGKTSVGCLGQLSIKEEAAGKGRVFALVDV